MLELGIVLGVIAVLLGATLPTLFGQIQATKFERVGLDLQGLLDAAQLYWQRNVEVSWQGAGSAAASMTAALADGKDPLDLSRPSDREKLIPLLPASFSGSTPFDPPYGLPYKVVFAARRVTVTACVPRSGGDPSNYGTSAPLITVDCSGSECGDGLCLVSATRSWPAGRMPGLMMTRKHLYWGR